MVDVNRCDPRLSDRLSSQPILLFTSRITGLPKDRTCVRAPMQTRHTPHRAASSPDRSADPVARSRRVRLRSEEVVTRGSSSNVVVFLKREPPPPAVCSDRDLCPEGYFLPRTGCKVPGPFLFRLYLSAQRSFDANCYTHVSAATSSTQIPFTWEAVRSGHLSVRSFIR